jgi:hypothetical protein
MIVWIKNSMKTRIKKASRKAQASGKKSSARRKPQKATARASR